MRTAIALVVLAVVILVAAGLDESTRPTASRARVAASAPQHEPAADLPEGPSAVAAAIASAPAADLIFIASTSPLARARRAPPRTAAPANGPGQWLLSHDPGFSLRC